jgi:hypothetical protein
MMGRLKHDQQQLFYSFHLDEAVPHDHPIRKIAAVLDLSWVRSELAPFYPEMGRPSINPELMIRMLIIGYVFAIRLSSGFKSGGRDRRKQRHRSGDSEASTGRRAHLTAASNVMLIQTSSRRASRTMTNT